MRQVYYPIKKMQTEKCTYCLDLEKQLEFGQDKVATLDRFLTKTKMPLNEKERAKLSNEMLFTAICLEDVRRKVNGCKFPDCSQCGRDE
jgi:hypothetical protein